MIDVSDGLAVDLWRLVVASDVGCEVDATLVPQDPALAESRAVADPLETAIVGGEDYELLFTMDDGRVDDVRRGLEALGTRLTRIGVVTDGRRTIGGRDLDEWRSKAWEHLSSS
jgi:thiamine-monophosphate kinase